MKSLKNRLNMAAITLGISLLSAQVGLAGSGVSTFTWRYPTSANPAQMAGAGQTGVGLANIAVGQFGVGWLQGNPVFGKASGIWDLGQNGTMTLNNVSQLIGNASQPRTFTLRVVQYIDGAIYNEFATVTVSGAQNVATSQTTLTALTTDASMGEWVAVDTQWSVPAGVTVNQVVIAGGLTGGLINQVALTSATATFVLPSPQLTIQTISSGEVRVSWPADNSGVVLQSTSDLNNANSWTPVGASVQTIGGVNSVTLEATSAQQFYRLAQP
jgi:hypothetical protein